MPALPQVPGSGGATAARRAADSAPAMERVRAFSDPGRVREAAPRPRRTPTAPARVQASLLQKRAELQERRNAPPVLGLADASQHAGWTARWTRYLPCPKVCRARPDAGGPPGQTHAPFWKIVAAPLSKMMPGVLPVAPIVLAPAVSSAAGEGASVAVITGLGCAGSCIVGFATIVSQFVRIEALAPHWKRVVAVQGAWTVALAALPAYVAHAYLEAHPEPTLADAVGCVGAGCLAAGAAATLGGAICAEHTSATLKRKKGVLWLKPHRVAAAAPLGALVALWSASLASIALLGTTKMSDGERAAAQLGSMVVVKLVYRFLFVRLHLRMVHKKKAKKAAAARNPDLARKRGSRLKCAWWSRLAKGREEPAALDGQEDETDSGGATEANLARKRGVKLKCAWWSRLAKGKQEPAALGGQDDRKDSDGATEGKQEPPALAGMGPAEEANARGQQDQSRLADLAKTGASGKKVATGGPAALEGMASTDAAGTAEGKNEGSAQHIVASPTRNTQDAGGEDATDDDGTFLFSMLVFESSIAMAEKFLLYQTPTLAALLVAIVASEGMEVGSRLLMLGGFNAMQAHQEERLFTGSVSFSKGLSRMKSSVSRAQSFGQSFRPQRSLTSLKWGRGRVTPVSSLPTPATSLKLAAAATDARGTGADATAALGTVVVQEPAGRLEQRPHGPTADTGTSARLPRGSSARQGRPPASPGRQEDTKGGHEAPARSGLEAGAVLCTHGRTNPMGEQPSGGLLVPSAVQKTRRRSTFIGTVGAQLHFGVNPDKTPKSRREVERTRGKVGMLLYVEAAAEVQAHADCLLANLFVSLVPLCLWLWGGEENKDAAVRVMVATPSLGANWKDASKRPEDNVVLLLPLVAVGRVLVGLAHALVGDYVCLVLERRAGVCSEKFALERAGLETPAKVGTLALMPATGIVASVLGLAFAAMVGRH